MTPGRLLHSLAHWCPDRARVQVLEPLVADLQHEWSASRRVGRLLRGYVAFCWAFAVCVGQSVAREAVRPPPRIFSMRVGAAFAATLGAATIFQFALIPLWPMPIALNWTPFGLMVARGLTLGVPMATLTTIMYARAKQPHSRAADAFKTGLAGVLLTLVVVGWISPLGTRAYGMHLVSQLRLPTQSVAGRESFHPERAVDANPGAKTWPELARAARGASVWAQNYQRESGRRAELVILSIVLAFAGWTLGRLRPELALSRSMGCCVLALLVTQTSNSGTAITMFALSTVLLHLGGRNARMASHLGLRKAT
jgi:hypothetical protein